MERSLFNRLQATVLALATLGLFVLAVLNFRQETQFQQPDDGIWWREVRGGLEAVKVLPNSPGQRAGIQEHDILTAAEVLPDIPAARVEMPTPNSNQDLLNGEKPLTESEPARPEITAKRPLPRNTIAKLSDLEHVLYETEVYGKASYAITRAGTPLDTPIPVIPEPLDRGLAQAQRIIGLVYLAIGIYVLSAAGERPAPHTFIFSALSRLPCAH